jgi:hypothetical protein
MSSSISIRIGDQIFPAELDDSPAAARVVAALPLKVRMSRWGDEYYGDCGLSIPGDSSARELMEAGEIAYWPPGSALCFFFGPTPASTDERPRAASPVLPIGKLTGSLEGLKRLKTKIEAEITIG